MKKAMRIYNDVLAYIGVIGLIGFLSTVLLQVTSRTFLPTAPNWTEEASRFLFIFMVGFAGNTAVSTDGYVGVELLTEHFPAALQKIIKILVLVAILVFSAIVFYFCVIGPEGLLAMTPPLMVSTALQLPMKYVYIALAILYGLYIISYLMRIYCVITDTDIYEDVKKEA